MFAVIIMDRYPTQDITRVHFGRKTAYLFLIYTENTLELQSIMENLATSGGIDGMVVSEEEFPHLFSFAKNQDIFIEREKLANTNNLYDLFFTRGNLYDLFNLPYLQ
jgi:hypothetical protein